MSGNIVSSKVPTIHSPVKNMNKLPVKKIGLAKLKGNGYLGEEKRLRELAAHMIEHWMQSREEGVYQSLLWFNTTLSSVSPDPVPRAPRNWPKSH